MWTQVSLNDALRGFLEGRPMKIVDVEVGSIENLQEALQSFFEGAVFLAEVKEKPEPPTATDAGLPVQNVKQTISDAVRQVAEDLVPTATAPEPPRVTREKKQLEEAEKAYQSRKISDVGKLRSLRAAGWDVEKIATEFGCSGQTVRNTMKREGIE